MTSLICRHTEELEKKAKEKLVSAEDFALLNFDVVKKGVILCVLRLTIRIY